MLWIAFAIVFFVSFGIKNTDAALNVKPQFGGRIISTKAVEIQELEYMGYECPVFGSSISITPIGSPLGTPTSYFIPFYNISKTGTSIMTGQLIIGKYSWKTPITCIRLEPPSIKPVFLDTITLFGTSKV